MKAFDIETITDKENHTGPEAGAEELVIRLFQKVLNCRVSVGPCDNFFALGGNSFRGMKLTAEAASLGYEISLKDIIIHPVVKDLAKVIRPKESSASQEKQQDSIIKKWEYRPDDAERAAIEKYVGWQRVSSIYPMISSEREGFIFNGREAYYNTSIMIIHSSDGTEIQRCKDRFSALCAARQCLRTVMVIPDGKVPVKVVLKESENDLFYIDLSKQGKAAFYRYVTTLQRMLSSRGLEQGRPPFCCGIIRTGDNDYALLVIKSHFILDGIGTLRLMSELMGEGELLPDDEEYRSYYSGLDGMNSGEALSYWNDLLKGISGVCMLPQADAGVTSAESVFMSKMLGRETSARVNEYCRDSGVSVSALMCAALGKSLTEYLGDDRLCFLVCGSGRPASLTADPALMGNFVSKFPFVYSRGDTPQDCQRQLAESVRYQMTDTALLFADQELPQNHCRSVVLDVLDIYEGDKDKQHDIMLLNPDLKSVKPYNVNFIVNTSGVYKLFIQADPEICKAEAAEIIAEGMKNNIESILLPNAGSCC